MVRSLKTQAENQQAKFATQQAAAIAALTAAQDERDRRVADPTAVAPADRYAQFGAAQYSEQANAALATLRAAERAVRDQLAVVATPADVVALEAQLLDNLVGQASARVVVRAADERLEVAKRSADQAAQASARATAQLNDSTAWVAAATDRQATHEGWRAALGQPPLSTIVADAATLNGAPRTAATNRLEALLPSALWDRASARADEAKQSAKSASDRLDAARAQLAASRTARSAIDGAVDNAWDNLALAEDAAAQYVINAPADLSRAGKLLAPIAALPNLTSEQTAALDPAPRTDAQSALTKEQALATARKAWNDKDLAVDTARVRAVAAAPDTDPATVQAVIDAVAARDLSPGTGKDLADARAGYTPALEHALDEWEAAVPDDLWQAAIDFFEATAIIERLSDAAARTAVTTDLDTAVDALANALDDHAVSRRAIAATADTVQADADSVSVRQRNERALFANYVRGDGRGGRSAIEA